MVTAGPSRFRWRDNVTPKGGLRLSRCSRRSGAAPAQARGEGEWQFHPRPNQSRRHNKLEKCFVYKQDSPQAVLGILDL